MVSQDDDRALLARVAAGDADAMRRLYERHYDALHAFVRARSGDAAATPDIVHDTMLDVWRQAGRFRGGSSVRTWMFSIARNKAVDRVRGGARLSFVDEVPETADDAPDAAAVIEAAEDAERVRACLATLKPAQRAAVRLAFYEGLTYEEIAEVESIPAGTVKTRIFHAKRALMHCLGRR